MTFRSNPPPNYHPPSDHQVEVASKGVDLEDKYSTDLVKDITNLAAGGTLTAREDWPQDHLDAELVESLKKVKKHPRSNDHRVHPDLPSYYYNDDSGHAELKRDLKSYENMRHVNAQEFAQNLDLSRFPEGSPLNRSVQGLKVLAARSAGTSAGGEEAMDSPFSGNKGDGAKAAQEVHEALERADNMDDTDGMLLGLGKGGGDGEAGGDLITKAIASMEVKEILDISRHMQGTTALQIGTAPTYKEDPLGKERIARPMRSISEMHRLRQSEWGYPTNYRTYRMVTGQAQIVDRYSREANKQFLYVIVDRSGSMGGRIDKAVGVLYDRLRAVVEGDAELYFAYFQEDLEQEHEVRTPEQAKALLTKARAMRPDGGTNIAQSLRTCVARIEGRMADDPTLVRPEIALVSDGEANLPHVSDLGKCKLNVFNIDMVNGPLCQLARSTGGVGVDRL